MECHILLSKACERLSNGREAFHDLYVDVGKANEELYIAERPGMFPILASGNLLGVHFNTLTQDDYAQECDFLNMEQ